MCFQSTTWQLTHSKPKVGSERTSIKTKPLTNKNMVVVQKQLARFVMVSRLLQVNHYSQTFQTWNSIFEVTAVLTSNPIKYTTMIAVLQVVISRCFLPSLTTLHLVSTLTILKKFSQLSPVKKNKQVTYISTFGSFFLSFFTLYRFKTTEKTGRHQTQLDLLQALQDKLQSRTRTIQNPNTGDRAMIFSE